MHLPHRLDNRPPMGEPRTEVQKQEAERRRKESKTASVMDTLRFELRDAKILQSEVATELNRARLMCSQPEVRTILAAAIQRLRGNHGQRK